MTTVVETETVEITPHERATELAQKLDGLRKREAEITGRIGVTAARLAEIGREEHEARVLRVAEEITTDELAETLAAGGEEAASLQVEQEALQADVSPLSEVISHVAAEYAEVARDVALADARSVLAEQRQLLGRAGKQFGALVETWRLIATNAYELQRVRETAPDDRDLRRQLIGASPFPSNFSSFVHALLQFSMSESPLGGHALPPLRGFVGVSPELAKTTWFADVPSYTGGRP